MTIHIKKVHKSEPRVQKILCKSPKSQIYSFTEIRREGIYLENVDKIKKKKNDLKSDKKLRSQTQSILCSNCNCFFSKSYIRRHHNKCHPTKKSNFSSFFSLSNIQEKEFVEEILVHFRSDEIGKLCILDEYLLEIGKWLWSKYRHKKDKKVEAKNIVRRDMRHLAVIYQEIMNLETAFGSLSSKYGDIRDLFAKENIKFLFQAIKNLSVADSGKTKPGFKINSKYLLIRTAKILRIIYLMNDNELQANDIDKFLSLINITEGDIFGDAVYELNNNRNINLRRPQSLPLEEDIKKLREYLIKNISFITGKDNLNSKDFTSLRDLVVCRLTLFNARRGGEPCRLSIEDWKDAKNGTWIDEKNTLKLDEIEKKILDKVKITYQTGKGNNHLVPILFPVDTFKGIDMICCPDRRAKLKIPLENKYLFPSLHGSTSHVIGWYCFNKVCVDAEVQEKDLLTATKNRHRISSLFALMDINESDREYIYKHLGHSSVINKNIYQSPLVMKELSIVGRRLLDLDEATSTSNNMENNEKDSNKINNAENFEMVEDPDDLLPCKRKFEEDIDNPLPLKKNSEENQINNITFIKSKPRQFHRWTHEENMTILQYFSKYIAGKAEKSLPGMPAVFVTFYGC